MVAPPVLDQVEAQGRHVLPKLLAAFLGGLDMPFVAPVHHDALAGLGGVVEQFEEVHEGLRGRAVEVDDLEIEHDLGPVDLGQITVQPVEHRLIELGGVLRSGLAPDGMDVQIRIEDDGRGRSGLVQDNFSVPPAFDEIPGKIRGFVALGLEGVIRTAWPARPSR